MAKKSGSGTKKNAKVGSGQAAPPPPSPAAPLQLPREHWGKEPSEHDYPAAASYLSLVCEPTDVRRLVAELKTAPLVHHKAKDLLRASGLALLPEDNFHVAADLTKIAQGEPLSPVLLLRGDFRRDMPLTIADGYHRVCASYHVDENADIPCHLIDHRGLASVTGFRVGAGSAGAGAGTGAPGGGTAEPGAGTGSGKGVSEDH
jgi:hypothetical protein